MIQNKLWQGRDMAGAYLDRGIGYFTADRYELALADFDRALEIWPTLTGALVFRGTAHFVLDHPDKAIADFTAAVAQSPEDP